MSGMRPGTQTPLTARAGRRSGALFRHDRKIAINVARSVFAGWTDRLIGAAVLLGGFAALHASFGQHGFPVRASAVAALGAGAGIGVALMIGRRLEFHASDGVLAVDALIDRERRRYAAAWHLVALAGWSVAALVVSPRETGFGAAGYLAGAVAGALIDRLKFCGLRVPARARRVRLWLQRPIAGAAMGSAVAVLAIPAQRLDSVPQGALLGSAALLAALALTMLDAAAIRFMTSSGHGGWSIIGRRMRGPGVFAAIAVAACLALDEAAAAALVAAATTAALAVMATRVLAYRRHAKRTAEMIVTLCLGAIGIAGVAAPPVVPLLTLAVLWHLHRRSADCTWMLA